MRVSSSHSSNRLPRFPSHLSLYSLLTVPIVLLVAGCVFYNTYFNAISAYEDAEKMRSAEPDRKPLPAEKKLYDRTIKKCAKIITEYPTSEWRDDAVLLMGKAFYRKGEVDKALTKFMELRTLYSDSDLVDKAKYFEALTLIEMDEFFKARLILQHLLKAGAEGAEIPMLVADCFREEGEPDSALVRYELGLESAVTEEERANILLKAGETRTEMGEYDKALRFFSEGEVYHKISRDLSFKLMFSAAQCLKAQGAVLESLNRLEKLSGLEEFFEFNYETLLEMAGIEADSVILESRLKVIGPDSDAENFRRERLEKAASIYRDVTNRYPRTDASATAYYRLGMLYRNRLENLEEAQESFAAVTREKPGGDLSKKALIESAGIVKLNLLNEKLDMTEDEEERAEILLKLGEHYLINIGKPVPALEKYSQVVTISPNSSWARKASLAKAWINRYRLGKREEADSLYGFVVEMYPDTDEAAKAALELESLE